MCISNIYHNFTNLICTGSACFVAETLDEMGVLGMHECPLCPRQVHLDTSNGQRMLAHIGSHVLYNRSIDRALEPCGLCLHPASVCTIYLTKRSGRNSQWTIKYGGTVPCPNTTSFSYTIAMTSTTSLPCSNVPLLCPYCPDGTPAVWCYNMRSHFRHRHQGIDPDKH